MTIKHFSPVLRKLEKLIEVHEEELENQIGIQTGGWRFVSTCDVEAA